MSLEDRYGLMPEPDQNCKHINKMVSEVEQYLDHQGKDVLKKHAHRLKRRFSVMREWGGSLQDFIEDNVP